MLEAIEKLKAGQNGDKSKRGAAILVCEGHDDVMNVLSHLSMGQGCLLV